MGKTSTGLCMMESVQSKKKSITSPKTWACPWAHEGRQNWLRSARRASWRKGRRGDLSQPANCVCISHSSIRRKQTHFLSHTLMGDATSWWIYACVQQQSQVLSHLGIAHFAVHEQLCSVCCPNSFTISIHDHFRVWPGSAT